MPRAPAMSGTTPTLPFYQVSATVITTLVVAAVVSMRGLGSDDDGRPAWLGIVSGIYLTLLPLVGELLCLSALANGHGGRLATSMVFVSIGTLFGFILSYSLKPLLAKLGQRAENIALAFAIGLPQVAAIMTAWIVIT
jgi:hypothetical protein